MIRGEKRLSRVPRMSAKIGAVPGERLRIDFRNRWFLRVVRCLFSSRRVTVAPLHAIDGDCAARHVLDDPLPERNHGCAGGSE